MNNNSGLLDLYLSILSNNKIKVNNDAISNLQNQVQQLRQNFSQLQSSVNQNTNTISNLQNQVQQLTQNLSQLQSSVNQNTNTNTTSDNNTDTISNVGNPVINLTINNDGETEPIDVECTCSGFIRTIFGSSGTVNANICSECNLNGSNVFIHLPIDFPPGNFFTFISDSISQPLCEISSRGFSLVVGGTGQLAFNGENHLATFMLAMIETGTLGSGDPDEYRFTFNYFDNAGVLTSVQFEEKSVPDNDLRVETCLEPPGGLTVPVTTSNVPLVRSRETQSFTKTANGVTEEIPFL